MAKVTFSLDDATVETLRKTANRLRKPQSLVVREAIAQYAAQEDRLSDEERERMLKVIDRAMKLPPSRSRAEVDRELRDISRSRRIGWRPGAR
jgi:DNA helicase HerA-like ATPase